MRSHRSPSPELEVRDCFGRPYRIGLDAQALLGHPRSWMRWLPGVAMAAIGVLQYGFGATIPALVAAHDWRPASVFWLLALWTVFQAGVGFRAALLAERRVVEPRTTMLIGAVLCALGPVSLAHAPNIWVAFLGYSALSGTGAGLVYAACTSTVAKWHPERAAGRVSLVTGAFAYGSVPFALGYVIGLRPDNLAFVLDGTAVLIGLAVAAAGGFFRDPPQYWWPTHIDPKQWALDRERGQGRAARQFSPREALHTGVLPAMYLMLLCASAVSLFNVTFLVTMSVHLGHGVALIAVLAAVLLAANGIGRALAIRVAGLAGRRRTLRDVLALLGVGQLFFAAAASTGSGVVLTVAVLLAGAGGGAFYPLFASLVRGYFGEQNTVEIQGIVYSAKAFGGVVGVGAAALLTPVLDYPTTFLIAGALALGSATLGRRLRQPGRIPMLPTARHSTT